MSIYEKAIRIPKGDIRDLLGHFRSQLSREKRLIRFVVTSSDEKFFNCEIGVCDIADAPAQPSIFEFRKRPYENQGTFNTALVIPTGIGAETGGHAGDGGPAAQLIGQVSDNVILHPNAVNAAEINEMPSNSIYVEGSTLSRLMMGVVGLKPVRSNRILTVLDNNPMVNVLNLHVNAVGAARAAAGVDCDHSLILDPGIMARVTKSETGRAAGEIANLAQVYEALKGRISGFDAVAIVSILNVPPSTYEEYFESYDDDVNPWGGVEAMLTHTLTELLGVPTAHAPMHNDAWDEYDPGVIDPRKSAEIISFSNTICVYKGLRQSPKIITDPSHLDSSSVISAKDVSCLVIPDNCLGLPTLAALYQGIPVVAVKNKNLMQNDLAALPWRRGQFRRVNSYFEAAGVISAMKAGISLESLERPMRKTTVEKVTLRQGEVTWRPDESKSL